MSMAAACAGQEGPVETSRAELWAGGWGSLGAVSHHSPNLMLPGRGLSSHPVSDRPAEMVLSKSLNFQTPGMAAAGNRGPEEPPGLRVGSFSLCFYLPVSASLSLSHLCLTLISEPLTQTSYCTPEGLLQPPKTFIEYLLYVGPFTRKPHNTIPVG